MQDKKKQLEWDMETWTGSKLVKEYVKDVYCHPAYLTYMQSSVVWWFEHFFDITFLWDWNENCDLFQSCSHY